MNPIILIHLFLLSLLNPCYATKKIKNKQKKAEPPQRIDPEVSELNLLLNDWDTQIYSFRSASNKLESFETIIPIVTEKLNRVKHVPTLQRIHSFIMDSLQHLTIIPQTFEMEQLCRAPMDNSGIKSRCLKLMADVNEFIPVLFDSKALSEEEKFEIFILASLELFTNGPFIRESPLPSLLEKFNDSKLLLKSICFFLMYMRVDAKVINHKDLIEFFFSAAKIVTERNFTFASIVDDVKVGNSCLSFIHKHKLLFAGNKYFRLWKKYFFEEHLNFNESELKMIFDFGSEIDDLKDIEIFVLLFSSNNNFNLIFSKPDLMETALNVLVQIHDNYNEGLLSLANTLPFNIRNVLLARVNSKAASFKACSLLSCLKEMVLNESEFSLANFKKLKTALIAMAEVQFNLLKAEEVQGINVLLIEKFSLLYDNYLIDSNEDKLFLLNFFVPIIAKLSKNNISDQVYLKAVDVTCKVSDIFERYLGGQIDKISTTEFLKISSCFHGEIFRNSQDSALNFLKFFKYWKFSASQFKDFYRFMPLGTGLTDSIFILNLLHRIKTLKNNQENLDLEEIHKIPEIINFFYQDLNILSKTQMIALHLLII